MSKWLILAAVSLGGLVTAAGSAQTIASGDRCLQGYPEEIEYPVTGPQHNYMHYKQEAHALYIEYQKAKAADGGTLTPGQEADFKARYANVMRHIYANSACVWDTRFHRPRESGAAY